MNVPSAPGNERSSSAFDATSYDTGMSFAPSARIRSSFDFGAVSITTTAHGTPPPSARDALSCISRPDRPYTALALRIGEQRYGIRRAAQLVGTNGLQVLKFKSNIGKIWSELQADKRRAHDRVCNSFARFFYF